MSKAVQYFMFNDKKNMIFIFDFDFPYELVCVNVFVYNTRPPICVNRLLSNWITAWVTRSFLDYCNCHGRICKVNITIYHVSKTKTYDVMMTLLNNNYNELNDVILLRHIEVDVMTSAKRKKRLRKRRNYVFLLIAWR